MRFTYNFLRQRNSDSEFQDCLSYRTNAICVALILFVPSLMEPSWLATCTSHIAQWIFVQFQSLIINFFYPLPTAFPYYYTCYPTKEAQNTQPKVPNFLIEKNNQKGKKVVINPNWNY